VFGGSIFNFLFFFFFCLTAERRAQLQRSRSRQDLNLTGNLTREIELSDAVLDNGGPPESGRRPRPSKGEEESEAEQLLQRLKEL
jgi:hypothetical protein